MKKKTSFDKFLDWGYGFGEVMVFAFVLTPLTMCFIVGTLMLVGGVVQYINQQDPSVGTPYQQKAVIDLLDYLLRLFSFQLST